MIICEPVSVGMGHIPINFRIIEEIIKNKSTDENIKFLCEEQHWQYLQEDLTPNILSDIEFIPINPQGRETCIKEWFKQIFLLSKIKKISKTNEKWFFLSTSVPILWWLCFLFKSHKPVLIIHAVLNEVKYWNSLNPFKIIISLRMIIRFLSALMPKIIVLEKYIQSNLLNDFPKISKKVEVIPHPIPLDKYFKKEKILEKTLISFPGNFTLNKGANDFITIAKKFHENNILFSVIGKNSLDFEKSLLTLSLHEGPFIDYLKREEYVSKIIESDFIFIGLNPKFYKWAASGVFLDALYYEVPVIIKKTKEEMGKDTLPVGYSYSSISELEEIINMFCNNKNKVMLDKVNFIENIKKIKFNRENDFRESIARILSF